MAESNKSRIEGWLTEEEFTHATEIVRMGKTAAEILADKVSTSRDKLIRQRALYTLGKIGGEPAVKALEAALRSRDPVMRVMAIQSVRDTPERYVAESALLEGVLRSLSVKDESVRLTAAKALGELTVSGTVPGARSELEKAAMEDPSAVVREAASLALSSAIREPDDNESVLDPPEPSS